MENLQFREEFRFCGFVFNSKLIASARARKVKHEDQAALLFKVRRSNFSIESKAFAFFI